MQLPVRCGGTQNARHLELSEAGEEQRGGSRPGAAPWESLTGVGGQEFAGRLAGALGPWRLIAGTEK